MHEKLFYLFSANNPRKNEKRDDWLAWFSTTPIATEHFLKIFREKTSEKPEMTSARRLTV